MKNILQQFLQIGKVYLWGNNKNGECASRDIKQDKLGTVNFNAINITAGNGISIIQAEDKKVYVLGNNVEGQIGASGKTSVYEAQEIDLGIEIENISAGAGSHSVLISKEGFVYMTGTNTYGELGNRKQYKQFKLYQNWKNRSNN